MIKIESKKNKFTYNVYHVTKAFYPKEDVHINILGMKEFEL